MGMYIIKKDGTKEPFNVQKVVAAVNKSAERVLYTFKPDELDFICRFVTEKCEALGADGIMIAQMHNIVEGALDAINPAVAKSYRDYRNYKTDFVQMLDTVYKKSQSIMYIGDKENSNADSALVSTRRSLIFNQLNKQLYQKFFLTVEELQAQRDGYIYIHDMSARRDTMNCCLFDVGAVLRGGFEMGNLWYNEPKTLNLKEMLTYYIRHQEDVVTRRTKYELNKAEERAHILQGLLIALDNIDEVIRIIRGSENTQAAKAGLIERFALSDAQAQAIVDMRLRALNGLERAKLEKEYKELMERIGELKAILADEKKLLGVIKDEIALIRDKYGDERRTQIGFDVDDISMEDLIPRENTVITMTKLGYIKRMTVDNFKSQNRGGKGIKGMQTIDEDYIEELFMTTTHHYIMFFTNTGRVYRLKAYEIPESGRTARGSAIVNLLQLQPGEKITAVIPLVDYEEGKYLLMATKYGVVKKSSIMEYANIRKTGLAAITLKDDDQLIEVKYTEDDEDVFLVTKNGQCIRFHESDVRCIGRTSMGVRGINLTGDDEVIGMQLDSQGEALLIVSANGMGKRTLTSEFTAQHRGGKGIKCYKITEKTGDVVGVKAVNDDNEIMMITTEGIIIRTAVDSISILGRNTSGVKVMNVGENVEVASIAKVREEKLEDEQEENTTEE